MRDITREEFKQALERIRAGADIGQDRETVIRYCLQQTCESNWQIEGETASGNRVRWAADILFAETAGRLRAEIEQHARGDVNFRILHDMP